MLKIADLGRTFGIAGGSVFRDPWKNEAEVVVPKSYQDFVDMIDDINLVIFGGGADIHPSLYNHLNVASYTGSAPSTRDYNEVASYKVCIQRSIPVLGICRGAQLACAIAGGSLIQNVTNHAGGDHNIVDVQTKEIFSITSAHHQMMYPNKVPHKMIATVEKNLSRGYSYDGSKLFMETSTFVEPEIVFFPAINSLAVQGHPEFMHSEDKAVVYVRKLVNEYLLKGAIKDV